jgi:protein TonB
MTEKELRELPLEGISPEVDELARQLASLEAELDRQTQSYSNMPRVRRLTSISAKQAVDAAYLLDWRQRVEAVGNKYYPEASVRYGIYGSLRLLVVIRNDGSLEDIRVLSSSGHAVLDEAAIKIVRMAAPYSPFPPELKATTDKLEIIRTWQFQENQLSSG